MSYMNKTSLLDEMLNEMPQDVTSATFDFEKSELGMTLQRLDGREWEDYVVDGEAVKSPVDIDKLPAGRYRLIE